mgnify:FL=1
MKILMPILSLLFAFMVAVTPLMILIAITLKVVMWMGL